MIHQLMSKSVSALSHVAISLCRLSKITMFGVINTSTQIAKVAIIVFATFRKVANYCASPFLEFCTLGQDFFNSLILQVTIRLRKSSASSQFTSISRVSWISRRQICRKCSRKWQNHRQKMEKTKYRGLDKVQNIPQLLCYKGLGKGWFDLADSNITK